MAKTEKNTVGTLEISFNEGNVMIVDHIRKVKILILECTYARFFDNEDFVYTDEKYNTKSFYGDDFVLIRKDDGTYGLYEAGFGFILKNQEALDFYPTHFKNFIATIITSRNEVLLLDAEGNITNLISLFVVGSETWPYMVLVTVNGKEVYNVLNIITGEFVFADWKDDIIKTDSNDYLVFDSSTGRRETYDKFFVLK